MRSGHQVLENLDFTLSKTVSLTERFRLVLHGDAFNALESHQSDWFGYDDQYARHFRPAHASDRSHDANWSARDLLALSIRPTTPWIR